MTFTEKKEQDFFVYNTEDFIGEITLKSKKRLSPNVLDGCVLRLANIEVSKGTFIAKDNVEVEFDLIRKSLWLEDEDNK